MGIASPLTAWLTDAMALPADAEITRLRVPRVLLWGHSSGAAFAVATAAKPGEAGVDVQRVFVAAQLPGDAADRRASITDLTGRSDAEIAAELTSGGARLSSGPISANWTRRAPSRLAPPTGTIACRTGSRDFLADTLDDVMAGRVTVPPDRTAVFSPFGLGVLDLAVGMYVYDQVVRAG